MIGVKLFGIITVAGLFTLSIVACQPVSAPELAPATGEPEKSASAIVPAETQQEVTAPAEAVPSVSPTATPLEEPELRDELQRNGAMTTSDGKGNFDDIGLRVGETAINFTLRDISGRELTLSRLLAEKPVMMVFGAFT